MFSDLKGTAYVCFFVVFFLTRVRGDLGQPFTAPLPKDLRHTDLRTLESRQVAPPVPPTHPISPACPSPPTRRRPRGTYSLPDKLAKDPSSPDYSSPDPLPSNYLPLVLLPSNYLPWSRCPRTIYPRAFHPAIRHRAHRPRTIFLPDPSFQNH